MCAHVCVCTVRVLSEAKEAGGQIQWECVCRESWKPLYPEPLRLRADGQPHTHRAIRTSEVVGGLGC